MLAARGGFVQVVRALLGSDKCTKDVINAKSYISRKTALMFAAENGHVQVVKDFLLSPIIDVNISNRFNMTALMFAKENGHVQVVRDFLDSDKCTNDGMTALSAIISFLML